MPKIAIITNIIPSYRQGLYDRLIEAYGNQITIYCHGTSDMNLVTIHERYAPNVKQVSYLGLSKETFGWQLLPFLEMRQYDVVFVYGNPRLLSNVVVSFLLKLLKKPIVIWGQAHTAGANPWSEGLRLLWWRYFRNILAYNDSEVEWLSAKGFRRSNLIGMNNGLDQNKIDTAREQWPPERLEQWKRAKSVHGRNLFLSCARLVSKNRFEDAIAMLAQLADRGFAPLWAVVGSGPEENRLKDLAQSKGVARQIIWVGALYEEMELAPWFLSADLFIHPSAIGLSLLHAMGYGLPVITQSDRAKQMPEFSAFIDGETGLLFKPEDIVNFTDQTLALLVNQERRHQMGYKAQHIARTQYNTDAMARRFQLMAARAIAGKQTLQ